MNDEEFNAYSLLAVLELLSSSKTFLNEYITKFPDNEQDALSFSVDTTCPCRDNLISHYNSNRAEVNEFTKEFIVNNSTELNWPAFIDKYKTFSAAGTRVKIDKTDTAYAELCAQMHRERWVFRHMSILEEDDKYVVFFA